MTDYEQKKFNEARAVSPTQILEEAKEESPEDYGRYAYMVAFMRLESKYSEAMEHYGSVMRELTNKACELDLLQWAAEKVLDKSHLELGEYQTIFEYLYSGAEVIRDLRDRGWDDDKIREHTITELEVENCRHLTAKDFCLNCDDRDEVVEEGQHFCAYCADEFVEVDSFVEAFA